MWLHNNEEAHFGTNTAARKSNLHLDSAHILLTLIRGRNYENLIQYAMYTWHLYPPFYVPIFPTLVTISKPQVKRLYYFYKWKPALVHQYS